jgi:ribosomal-protein-alanine N-acetyltransferase
LSIINPSTLKTKRITIRQFTQEDFDNIVSFTKDMASTNFNQLFKTIIDSYQSQEIGISYALILRNNGVFLGFCGLIALEDNLSMECYYFLRPEYWRNGYAIESLRMIFEYAFSELKLDKIIAYIDQGNTRGWKVAERSGMKYMGNILRKEPNLKGKKSMFFLIDKNDYNNQFQIKKQFSLLL